MLKYLTKVANRSGLDRHIRNNVYYGKNLGALAGALGAGALGGVGGAYTSAAKDILLSREGVLDYIKNVSKDAITHDLAGEAIKDKNWADALEGLLSKDIGLDYDAMLSKNPKAMAAGAIAAGLLGSKIVRPLGGIAGLAISPATYAASKTPSVINKFLKKSSYAKTAGAPAPHWLVGDLGREIGREQGKAAKSAIKKLVNSLSYNDESKEGVNKFLIALNMMHKGNKQALREAADQLKLKPEDLSLIDNYIGAGMGGAAGGALGAGIGALALPRLAKTPARVSTIERFLGKRPASPAINRSDVPTLTVGAGLAGALGGGAAGFKYLDDPELARRLYSYADGITGGLVSDVKLPGL